MPSILHDFPVAATPDAVFAAISTPEGLDQWWTKRSSGEARQGAMYELFFGSGYDWRGKVLLVTPDKEIEWEIVQADDDWKGTRVGFSLSGKDGGTYVRFHHAGWETTSEHYRISSFCWAMYLRILKRYVENGERVPYEERLDV